MTRADRRNQYFARGEWSILAHTGFSAHALVRLQRRKRMKGPFDYHPPRPLSYLRREENRLSVASRRNWPGAMTNPPPRSRHGSYADMASQWLRVYGKVVQ